MSRELGAAVKDAEIKPSVTVLMPVYNAESYVVAAIDSILAQTYRDFEFLIIDDGSTDQSAQIIRSYDDSRIRYYPNKSNQGLVRTLNKGLDLAQGKYIARMDADDISLPHRLEKQVAFMESNPAVGVCGAWVETFGEVEEIWRHPMAAEDIHAHLLFHNPLAHPSVCLRRQTFIERGLRYDEKYPHAEDFQLWQRAADCFPIVNIGEVLLKYNFHPRSVSRANEEIQAHSLRQIDKEALARLGIDASDAELDLHRCLGFGGERLKLVCSNDVERWLKTIQDANNRVHRYSRKALKLLCGELWLQVCWMKEQRITPRYLKSSLSWCLGLRRRTAFVVSYYRSILKLS